jgi:hypothetical protein
MIEAIELAERLQRRPFSPLVVQMNDGRVYEIRRPGLAIVTPTMIVIGIARANGSRLAERIVRCPIIEIASVDPVEATK